MFAQNIKIVIFKILTFDYYIYTSPLCTAYYYTFFLVNLTVCTPHFPVVDLFSVRCSLIASEITRLTNGILGRVPLFSNLPYYYSIMYFIVVPQYDQSSRVPFPFCFNSFKYLSMLIYFTEYVVSDSLVHNPSSPTPHFKAFKNYYCYYQRIPLLRVR